VAINTITLTLANKTDHHDISEIFLKVAFNTITLTLNCNVLKFISENEVWSTERLAASHRQTLSHNVSYTPHLGGIRTHNFSGDRY
jgi:hypothetical protein